MQNSDSLKSPLGGLGSSSSKALKGKGLLSSTGAFSMSGASLGGTGALTASGHGYEKKETLLNSLKQVE